MDEEQFLEWISIYKGISRADKLEENAKIELLRELICREKYHFARKELLSEEIIQQI